MVAELWLFNTSSNTWQLITSAAAGHLHPPGVMYASLNLVAGDWIYLFGGSLPHGEFSKDMYRLNMAASTKQWEKVRKFGTMSTARYDFCNDTVMYIVA